MKSIIFQPNHVVRFASRIFLFIVVLLSGTQLHAQNIILKEGLYYTPNGTLYSGIYNSYAQNGAKLASITLVDGKKNGTATYYYENGNVKEMGIFLNNEKNEQWLHWDEAGNKIAEPFIRKGRKTEHG